MRKPAGTFYEGKDGKPHPCMTEDGKPCSKHAGSEHIGTTYDEAEQYIQRKYSDTVFIGMSSLNPMFSDRTNNNDESFKMTDMMIRREKLNNDGNMPICMKIPVDYPAERISRIMFQSTPDARSMENELMDSANASWKSMTEHEKDSIRAYCSDAYEAMNAYQRGDDGIRADIDNDEFVKADLKNYGFRTVKGAISTMSRALRKTSTDTDTIVYRSRFTEASSGGRDMEERTFYDAGMNALETGEQAIIRKAGFSSTTTDLKSLFSGLGTPSDTPHNVKYVIKVPAGTHGMYVGGLSTNHEEKEFLMNKGMKYRIAGIFERGTYDDYENDWDAAPIIALEIMK